jgi:hypothetical protein
LRTQHATISDLQEKILELTTELERMASDVTQWRNAYESQDQENIKAAEVLDLEYRARLERELATQSARFSAEKQQVDNKNKELRQKGVEFENRIIFLTTEVARLNDNETEAKADADLWARKYEELRHASAAENEMLKQKYDDLALTLNHELELWRKKYEELEYNSVQEVEEAHNQINLMRRSSIVIFLKVFLNF